MSDAALEPRSIKSRQRWPKVSLVILFLLSASNIYVLLFIVPKFVQIYADALPGKPLEPLTNFIISGRIFLALAALACPSLGIFLIKYQKSHADLWINIGSFGVFVQIGLTFYALIIHMVGVYIGMSEAR